MTVESTSNLFSLNWLDHCQISRTGTQYLHVGIPILTDEMIGDFVNDVRITRPQETTLLHLGFVRNGCSGCSVHNEHFRYASLREIRKSDSKRKYITRLEQGCRYAQATYLWSQMCLAAMLENHKLAGACRYISVDKIKKGVQERIEIWGEVCLGAEKKWWQFWK